MRKDGIPHTGVRIGDVSGGISGSIIAGGNVTKSEAKFSRTHTTSPTGSVDDLLKLLSSISKDIEEIKKQRAVLTTTSASAPSRVQGAEDCVKAAVDKIASANKALDAHGALAEIKEAGAIVSSLTETVTSALKGATGVATAASPLISLLAPLSHKLASASEWIATLWP